jgi:Holliday junction resolvasome RuvABC endonuclease subunit
VSAAEDLLAKVRNHAPAQGGTKKIFRRPWRDDFRDGLVLNFDQSLSKTGWSLLAANAEALGVLDCGVLESHPAGLTGFEETFAKDAAMGAQIEHVIESVAPRAYWTGLEAIVHEMPSVKGYRLESSLMAAAAVRRAARSICPDIPVVMISRQSAYAALVGAPSSEKAEGTAIVNRVVTVHHGSRWNQDIHDSVLLGLKHLHHPREKR